MACRPCTGPFWAVGSLALLTAGLFGVCKYRYLSGPTEQRCFVLFQNKGDQKTAL